MHLLHSFSNCLWLAMAVLSPLAYAVTPAEQLAGYTAQAAAPADAVRGQKIFTTTYKRVTVGRASNCATCHANADKGNFNEHEVRIPK